MRVLCGVSGRDGAQLVERLLAQLGGGATALQLVLVIDEGPRHGLEALRGPLGRGPQVGAGRRAQMDQAEEQSGALVLAEAEAAARRAGVREVTTRLLRGEPGHILAALAAEGADMVAVGAHEGGGVWPPGPKSVGHVARFVLDHAPCSVLLVRPAPR